MKRPNTELTRKIYNVMKKDSHKSDWCEFVKRDLNEIGVHMDEDHIKQMDETKYKYLNKSKVRQNAFKN